MKYLTKTIVLIVLVLCGCQTDKVQEVHEVKENPAEKGLTRLVQRIIDKAWTKTEKLVEGNTRDQLLGALTPNGKIKLIIDPIGMSATDPRSTTQVESSKTGQPCIRLYALPLLNMAVDERMAWKDMPDFLIGVLLFETEAWKKPESPYILGADKKSEAYFQESLRIVSETIKHIPALRAGKIKLTGGLSKYSDIFEQNCKGVLPCKTLEDRLREDIQR